MFNRFFNPVILGLVVAACKLLGDTFPPTMPF